MRAADPTALNAWYRDCLGLDTDENGLWRGRWRRPCLRRSSPRPTTSGPATSGPCSTSESAISMRCSRNCAPREQTWPRRPMTWRASADSAGSLIPRQSGRALAGLAGGRARQLVHPQADPGSKCRCLGVVQRLPPAVLVDPVDAGPELPSSFHLGRSGRPSPRGRPARRSRTCPGRPGYRPGRRTASRGRARPKPSWTA